MFWYPLLMILNNLMNKICDILDLDNSDLLFAVFFFIVGFMIFSFSNNKDFSNKEYVHKNYKIYHPKTNLNKYYGSESFKNKIHRIIKSTLKDDKIVNGTSILLTGDPGSGKTYLAECIAGELSKPMISAKGSFDMLLVGTGTLNIQNMFKSARAFKNGAIILLDEIDLSINSNRSIYNYSQTTFASLLSELSSGQNDNLIIIGTSNSPISELDEALVRKGRFNYNINTYLPDVGEVYMFLKSYFTDVEPQDEAYIGDDFLKEMSYIFDGKGNHCNYSSLQQIIKEYQSFKRMYFKSECLNDRYLKWICAKQINNMTDLKQAIFILAWKNIMFEDKYKYIGMSDTYHTAVHEMGHLALFQSLYPIYSSRGVFAESNPSSIGYCVAEPVPNVLVPDFTLLLANIDISLAGVLSEEVVCGYHRSSLGGGSDMESVKSSIWSLFTLGLIDFKSKKKTVNLHGFYNNQYAKNIGQSMMLNTSYQLNSKEDLDIYNHFTSKYVYDRKLNISKFLQSNVQLIHRYALLLCTRGFLLFEEIKKFGSEIIRNPYKIEKEFDKKTIFKYFSTKVEAILSDF